jgi:hypothetical protein
MVLQTPNASSKLAVLSRWYRHQDPGWKPVIIAFLHRLGLSPTRSLRAGLLHILDLDRELERWAGDIKSGFFIYGILTVLILYHWATVLRPFLMLLQSLLTVK